MSRVRGRVIGVLLALVAVTTVGAVGSTADEGPAPPATRPAIERINIAGTSYRLELALDDVTRTKGLMGRRTIEPGTGMLFVFRNERVRSFWMANCLSDMDACFLDRHGRIVARHAMKTEPPRGQHESSWEYSRRLKRYSSRRPAQFVIELPPGSIAAHKLEVGAVIEFDRERLVRRAK